MRQTDALDAAILLGEEQLLLLQEGNVERFIEGIDAFAAVCDEIVRCARDLDAPCFRERLGRLLTSIDAVQMELGSQLQEAGSRMESLRRHERAASGYLTALAWAPRPNDRA